MEGQRRAADSATTANIIYTMSDLIAQHFGPSRPEISRRLCEKAGKQNAQLTKAERLLFLSRLDLYGKMLADPASLDALQFDQVCQRPPPDVLARTIKAITGLGSIAEVLREFWAPDRVDKLSYSALEAITMGWWTFDTSEVYAIDEDYSDDAVVTAVSVLAESIRPEEFAFENAARAKFLLPETTERDGEEPAPPLEEFQKSDEELEQIRDKYLSEVDEKAEQLKAVLKEQLEKQLTEASAEDLAAIKELRERMKVEVEEDVKEDEEREKEIEEAELLEEEEQRERREKKRAAREERRARGEATPEDESDSDEADYMDIDE